jgi:CHAT domain-containing protein
VLAACSTASGESVGPEGLAPLVRPLIAARVPAVVGTLWDVKDTATIKDLLVSLHRHYRNGADVAVALQQAQLAMLREPARTWAPLQVVGYAASPYAPHAAQEELTSEYVRTENSLHRPDGLHPQ